MSLDIRPRFASELSQIKRDVSGSPASWSGSASEIAKSKYFRNGERSVSELMNRVVRTIRQAGEQQGYFTGTAAKIFEDELLAILLTQRASFNSPVYFNVGVVPRPQASACFIQDVHDDLMSIFDLLKNEAKLFKFGSGTGTNFSRLRGRGESLESGGASTGVLSFLEIFDRAAHAIKSGGTNRRAAKMVILDVDHPDIIEFIRWKMLEERKARVLIAAGYSGGIDGEAFKTVSGQNSNNSVRVRDDFMRAVLNGDKWALRSRLSGNVIREISAAEIFSEMTKAAWECADPGIQFADAIARAHMCPNSGEIRASNPCGEFVFLDNSACNLASLNLVAFLDANGSDLLWEDLIHTVRILVLAQEILVDFASYPTEEIGHNSREFRPLGIGYANLGGLLMRLLVPYDSPVAATWTAKVTAALQSAALSASLEIATKRGPFSAWKSNRSEGLRVLENQFQHLQSRDLKLPWLESSFEQTLRQIEKHGLRHAQLTLLAPTGTIGLLMDCDTLGIEPEFSLTKRKHLSGGGEMTFLNRSCLFALNKLGYDQKEMIGHLERTGNLVGQVKEEHLPIFDCAIPPTEYPERVISAKGHLSVMAEAQPFLSGAISKTVNLPAKSTPEEVSDVYLSAWKLGLKSISVYRDSSKAVQPLCAEC